MGYTEQRLEFRQKLEWGRLWSLLADAGMVTGTPGPGDVTDWVTNVERITAMLALTAFHDIMKVEALLPRVLAEHAPFCGFQVGDASCCACCCACCCA